MKSAQEYEKLPECSTKRIAELKAEANNGHLVSLKELLLLATEAIEALKSLAETDAQFVAVVAQEQKSWPVLAAYKESLRGPHSPLLKAIKLMSADPMLCRAAEMGISTTPREYAVRLWNTLMFYEKLRNEEPEETLTCEWIGYNDEVYIFDKTVFQALKKYPSVAKESPATLWPLAQRLFLKLTNDRPWDIEGLSNYATANRVKERGDTENSKKNEVVKQVRQAFLNLGKPERKRKSKE